MENEMPENNIEVIEPTEAEPVEQEIEQVEQVEEAQEEAQEEIQDEITVTIGDAEEEKAEAAPEWVRDLRKKNREDQKLIRELQAKLAQQNPQPTLSKKPILEEFDYDTEKYETALSDWIDRKKGYESQLDAKKRDEDEQAQSWQNKLESYAQARTSLKVKDFEDAEATMSEMLNVTQQGVVIQGAENPALVIYALGKNPKKAKEIASIADPVKFAFAIAKLETQLKIANKKSVPAPEKVMSSSAPIRGAIDSNLDRLRSDAERTGDYSKVFAYKKQKKA